jgi:mannose-1-phosphate guanylyltransferase
MADKSLAQIDLAILAGGLGTRLRPVLADRPKILAPIEGRPFIEYMFRWLASFGASKVVLCLGHLAEKVIEHIETTPPPFDVRVSVETEPAGTAGALRLARRFLTSDPVLVLNGDSFVNVDMRTALAFHRARMPAGTIICTEVEDASRFGKVEVDAEGRILNFAEKTPTSGPGLINGGIYIFSAGFLDEICDSGARSLEHDILAKQPSGRLLAYAGRFRFVDIGLPEALRSASRSLLTGTGDE